MVEQRLKGLPKDEQGWEESRWNLEHLLRELSDVVRLKTLTGLLQVLRRLGITRQRARLYVHSPDGQYEQKVDYLKQMLSTCDNGRRVVVFVDQLTYYNQPSVASDYAPKKQQPKARQALDGVRTWRIIAGLNPFTGQVTALQRSKISASVLVDFFKALKQAYPQAQTIYVVLDNWPMHFYPDVLAALSPQATPFELHIPKSWQQLQPKKKYVDMEKLPIQFLTLPTYSSWLNPIEKLWKWLKQKFIHNHLFASCFKELQQSLDNYLDTLTKGSKELLQYCGLLKSDGIFDMCLQQHSAVI